MKLFSTTYNRNEALLQAEDSLLLVVDIQEGFRSVIHGMDSLIQKNALLLQAADRLDVPVVVTEQYPKGLGSTVKELSRVLPRQTPVLPKLSMSALGEDTIFQTLRQSQKRQIIVTGVESHVCVLQTVLDLLNNFDGWVYVARDAISSRSPADNTAAVDRTQAAGAHLITAEMVVFEWLKKAGGQAFKDIQNLLR